MLTTNYAVPASTGNSPPFSAQMVVSARLACIHPQVKGWRIVRLWLAFFFSLAALLTAPVALAMPASPDPFRVVQPDGSVFTAVVRGDEFQNWTETAEGYTVIKNAKTGYFEYAIPDANGLPVLSGVNVVPDGKAVGVPQSLWPARHLKPARNVELEQYQSQFLNDVKAKRLNAGGFFTTPSGVWAPSPVSGAKKILLILVNFADTTLQPGAATYWGNIVHSTTAASVAKYWKDVSFGTVTIAPVPTTQPGNPNGVVTVNLATTHPNCGKSCSYSTESAWINSALSAAAPYVNFASLDTNSDGTISVDEALVYFIVAGYEASAGASTPSVWAHAWGGSGVGVAGKAINHWAYNGERYNSSILMTMGVVTHEMGHAMGGLPDLYDISGSNGGLGIFSLMASGSWGSQVGETGGTTPVGLDAWSRQYLGWSTPQEPSNGSLVSFTSPLLSSTATVMLANGAMSTSEYWLVENRYPTSWDAGMGRTLGSWSGGLLIQHIDLNIGSKSANSFNKYVSGSHQGNMAVEPATATCTLVNPPGSWGGCLSLLYYAGNATTFNSLSSPTSNYYSGAQSGLGLTNISAPSATMTATAQTSAGSSGYTLSLSLIGSGAITSNPAGISCGSTCSASFASGTVVTLTATPNSGASFNGWGGACSGTATTCTVTMSSARSVSANFTTSGGGATVLQNGVAVTGIAGATDSNALYSISVPSGASNLLISTTGGTGDVDLYVRAGQAPTTSLYDCRPWLAGNSESCSVAAPVAGTYYIMLNGYAAYSGVSLVASYTGGTTTRQIALTKTGSGTVNSSPSGISCDSTCTSASGSFSSSSAVTLTATAGSGYAFAGWTGSCTGTSTCTIAAGTSAAAVGASFVAATPLTLSAATPTNGATGVSTTTTVVFTFSSPIKRGTGSISIKNGSGVTIETYDAVSSNALSISGNTLTITPSKSMGIFTKYSVVIPSGAIQDLNGVAYSGLTNYSFKTATIDSLYNFFVVAFSAAPGATYMGQLADAYNYGLSVQDIVGIFTSKSQFTDTYPTNMTHQQLATALINNIVKSSATSTVKTSGINDVAAALDAGWSVGRTIYQVFGNLAAMPTTDASWGNTAKQFQNQLVVARYFTETVGNTSTSLPALRNIISRVDNNSDVSTAAKIVAFFSGNTDIAITSHPQSTSVAANGSVALSVTATGGSALSYQWQKNGVDIAGATSPNYTVANVTDSAAYTVTISDASGTTTSNPANVTLQ